MSNKLTLALTAAALALAGTAHAAPTDLRGGPAAGRDRVITRADVEARADRMFARLDVNHDGKLDATDRAERRTEMLKARFERLDTDHNGVLSPAEFAASVEMGHHGFGRRGGDAGQPGLGRGERGEHMGRGMMMGRMGGIGHDGVVTQAEFRAAALARFDRMDTDHDGRVTPAERAAARAQMGERWHRPEVRDTAPPPAG